MGINVCLEGTLTMCPYSKVKLEGSPLRDYDLLGHGLLSRFIVLSMNTLL